MANATHRLYLDDSGNKDYSAAQRYSTRGGVTPHFVFGGMLVEQGEAGRIARDLRSLKAQYFGTPAVEIKANWLKRGLDRRVRYLQPYGLTEAALDAFVDEVYGLLDTVSGEFLAAVVNKAEMQAKYSNPWYPPAMAYECVVQRAQLSMEEAGGIVSVTVDDMSGANPKGNQHKENLKRHHQGLRVRGSRIIKMEMTRILDLGFSDSRADERLQLSDLIAYAVYRQFVDYGDKWDVPNPTLPLYKYLGALIRKFRRGPSGTFTGYGIVKCPRTSWQRWVVKNQGP